ncbi:type II toxin-antitoxin system Phd/YefM family antitoxin [Streptosporangium sp. NPDC004379]|uniref:type II toxin-antitoxin system Phd/YefM family antitoxin n=1 Tax=Streptosporangium sp. NPDC004379 TaxID=3366189 RepID=UPI00369EB37C
MAGILAGLQARRYRFFMEMIPISEAKDRLTELADRAAREHDHFTITRNGRPHAVIMSVAEWESLQETLEILADPEMRADLMEAAAATARGDVTTEEEMAAVMAARLGRASA